MFSIWCDKLTFISLCLLMFVLPATIAGAAIFSSLAILFFLLKKAAAVMAFRKDPGRPFAWRTLSVPLALPCSVPSVSIPVGIFVLVCFMSIFISVAPSLSAEAFVGKTLKTVFLFFAVQECMTTPLRVTWFIRVCLVSAGILCLDALWQWHTGFDFFKHHAMLDGRVNASFNHPNGLGAYLIIMVPLFAVVVLSWAVESGKTLGEKAVKIFLALTGITIFMVVMGLTFSRGAWFGLAAAGIVVLVLDKRVWIPCVVLAAIFFMVFHPLLTKGRQVTFIKDTVHSVGLQDMGGSGRIGYWKDALQIIRSRPVFGTGLNTYTKVIKESAWMNQNYAHNCYLQVMAELGAVGLAVILWVFAAVFMLVRRKILAEEPSATRLVLVALTAGWIGLLIESSVDNAFYSAQLSALLWMVMGLIVSLSSRKKGWSCAD